jgi:acyl-CoA thioesterase
MSDESDQALAERVTVAMMAKDAFSQALGMELVEVAPHMAKVRMKIGPDMLNGFGVCHGGVTFALADSALAFASNTHGQITMSIENSITYPKGVFEGDVLTAVAEEESATNRLAFYRVTVRSATDDIVALFRGTVYKTKEPFFSDTE